MTLLDAIREKLKDDSVTFAELSRLPGFNGDLSMCIDGDRASGIVLWSSKSREAIDAIETIRKEEEYELRPTAQLTYLIDGACLNLPLAKAMRHYKKPRWIPVVFKRRRDGQPRT